MPHVRLALTTVNLSIPFRNVMALNVAGDFL